MNPEANWIKWASRTWVAAFGRLLDNLYDRPKTAACELTPETIRK
jgi:hypothetical protein